MRLKIFYLALMIGVLLSTSCKGNRIEQQDGVPAINSVEEAIAFSVSGQDASKYFTDNGAPQWRGALKPPTGLLKDLSATLEWQTPMWASVIARYAVISEEKTFQYNQSFLLQSAGQDWLIVSIRDMPITEKLQPMEQIPEDVQATVVGLLEAVGRADNYKALSMLSGKALQNALQYESFLRNGLAATISDVQLSPVGFDEETQTGKLLATYKIKSAALTGTVMNVFSFSRVAGKWLITDVLPVRTIPD